MKVIGAGLPRTATSTQMIAFEMLGFGPCYHMRNVLADIEGQLPYWERAMDGAPDWEAVFGDAQSSCDWPSAYFAPQLAEYYPEAKVVLSVRDAEGWVRSMRETVWGIWFGESVMRYTSSARTIIDEPWRRYLTLMERFNWNPETGKMAGDTHDDAAFAAIFERYNEGIKATIPSDRLLVWNPRDGWGPLCEFLEVDVPSEDLPRVNDTSAFIDGITAGALGALNEWWDQSDRPSGTLHGAERTSQTPAG